jgi:NOL1/NOP2/fmu family ribosome biogenesis protein
MLDGCCEDMTKCRRIYPHKSNGEGQFIALFEKAEADEKESVESSSKKARRERAVANTKPNRAEQEALKAAGGFLQDNLIIKTERELMLLGGKIFLAPKIKLPEYNVFSAGVCVGECQKGRIIPHHQLFSAFGKDFKRKIRLQGEGEAAKKYLRGEEICSEGLVESLTGDMNGWAAVLIDGCAVGGAKNSGSTAKNHYPKGLRN